MTAYDWAAIKAKADIRSIIGAHVALKPKSGNLSGCCPFHDERTPSFVVYHDGYHCFGCGAHGDVVDFVMQFSGCDMAEALSRIGAGEFKMDDATQKLITDREAQRVADTARALREVRARWDAAQPVTSNPYLDRKGIGAYMARSEGQSLLLPVYNRDGELQSLQSIAPDGGKLFHHGAPMKGGRLCIGIPVGRTIVCEGFATGASIFESTPERVCVAFSISSVKDLVAELVEDGHPVAIAADNKGLDHILAFAAEIGVPVYAPPADSGCDDFNDYAVAHGHEAVAKVLRGDPLCGPVASSAKPDTPASPATTENMDPVDVWSRSSPPDLPTGLLPPLVERFATIRARMLGGDPGGLAMSALAVCAAAIPDHVSVKVKQNEDWTEQARIWVMLIGDPSSKKSPLMKAAARSISKIDSAMMRQYQQDLGKWQAAKKDGEEYEKPRETRLRIEDITMEAAQEVCKESPDGVLALQDELSGWFGGIEKYSGGKGSAKDRSFWLRAYNGGEYAVNRVGRGSFLIDNLSVSILGGIQPDALRKIMADATDDGLIQRFMPVVLPPARVGVDEPLPDVAAEYDALISALREVRTDAGMWGPMPIVMSAGAREIRSRLEHKHNADVIAMESVSKKFAAHIGKFDGMFARLCLIWHCIENANLPTLPGEISEETAAKVDAFLHGYVMGQSRAFYHGIIGISADQEQLEDVAGYILAHKVETVTMRTLQRGSRTMRSLTRQDGARIFEQLEALGWLEQVHKRNDAPSWKVDPKAHELFADKAVAELDSRRTVRDGLNKTLGKD